MGLGGMINMAVLLKTSPRKRAMRGSKAAQERYAARRKAKGVVKVKPSKPEPRPFTEEEIPQSMKRTATKRFRGSDAYKKWPVPQVRVTGPVNEKPTSFRRTGVRSSHGSSLAPGLERGVDPGLFRKPEHFAGQEEDKQLREAMDPRVQRIIDLMTESEKTPKPKSAFADMFGEESEENE